MIGSFGGFGGMGLGALSGLGGVAVTPEQIQERLKAAGVASVVPQPTPKPAMPVVPAPTGGMSSVVKADEKATPGKLSELFGGIGGGSSAKDGYDGGGINPGTGVYRPDGTEIRLYDPDNKRLKDYITASTPVPPVAAPVPPVAAPAPSVVAPVTPVVEPYVKPTKTISTPTLTPVTQPARSPEVQARIDESNAETERKRKLQDSQPTYSDRSGSLSDEDTVPNMTEFREALRTGYTGDDVDRVDDFYNMTFQDTMHDPEGDNLYFSDAMDFAEKGAMGTPLTKEEQMLNISDKAYFGQEGLPGYNKSRFYMPPPEEYMTDERKAETSALFGSMTDASSTGQVVDILSNYYGADVQPIEENRSFRGDLSGYTNASPELMAEFQSVIRPLMEEKVAYGMSVGKKDYHEAILDAYNSDPAIRAVYDKYGVSPTRTTAKGSEYIYDPLGYRDSRVVEKNPTLANAVKMAAALAFTAGIGGALSSTALFGGGTSALGTAAAKGLTSAGITAVTGGDTSDILKAGITAGVGSYGQELAKAAKAADFAAKGAKAGSDLAKAAATAKKASDTFNTVAKTVKFVDAAVDGRLAGAVVSTFGTDFTNAALDKVGLDADKLEEFNINQDDLTAGLVKTQLELAKGNDFGDAMLRGFGEYLMEGGSLGPDNIKTPEFIKVIGDVISETGSMIDDTFLQPIKGVVEPVIDVAKGVGSAVDDALLQPAIDVAKGVGSAVDDAILQPVSEFGSAVDDAILQPVSEFGSAVDDALIQPTIDVVKGVGSAVDDAVLQPAKDVAVATGDVIADVAEPIIDATRAVGDVVSGVDVGGVSLPPAEGGAQTSYRTPSIVRTPGIIRETGADIFDLGGKRGVGEDVDPIAQYLASLSGGGMAGGGVVRSSYDNLDELLRIVGGK